MKVLMILICVSVSAWAMGPPARPVVDPTQLGPGPTRMDADEARRLLRRVEAEVLTVVPTPVSPPGQSPLARSSLCFDDVEAIARQCPSVVAAAGIRRVRDEVSFGGRRWIPFSIFGTTPAYLDVRDWRKLSAGIAFTDDDVRNAAKVCLIGKTIIREVLKDAPPLGQTIVLTGVKLRVIGVLAPKGESPMGLDSDDIVIAPWTAFEPTTASSGAASEKVTSNDGGAAAAPAGPSAAENLPRSSSKVDQVVVRARSAETVKSASGQIMELLRTRHKIPADKASDFKIVDNLRWLKGLRAAATKAPPGWGDQVK